MIRLHSSPLAALQAPATWAAIGTLFMGAAALLDEPYKHWVVFTGLGCAALGILLGNPRPPEPKE
jgi:hypothetical protein